MANLPPRPVRRMAAGVEPAFPCCRRSDKAPLRPPVSSPHTASRGRWSPERGNRPVGRCRPAECPETARPAAGARPSLPPHRRPGRPPGGLHVGDDKREIMERREHSTRLGGIICIQISGGARHVHDPQTCQPTHALYPGFAATTEPAAPRTTLMGDRATARPGLQGQSIAAAGFPSSRQRRLIRCSASSSKPSNIHCRSQLSSSPLGMCASIASPTAS